MYGKFIAAAAIGTMMSTAAFAQNTNQQPNNPQKANPPAATAQKAETKADNTQKASASGQWQASKLIHMNVYNDKNEKIGDIKELMVDKSGKIDVVAIGVGGFLGMGEHDVAVKFDQLKWADAPAASASSKNAPATTGARPSDTAVKSPRNYPDHAILNATKDQLKSMPQFDYNK